MFSLCDELKSEIQFIIDKSREEKEVSATVLCAVTVLAVNKIDASSSTFVFCGI